MTTASFRTLTQGMMAYGASEVAAKASRLLVVVAVARTLELEHIGMAAAAIAAADIVKSLTENGVLQRIIAAPQSALSQTCNTAHRIFWMWCGGLCALQLLVSAAIWWSGGSALLSGLIALLAVEYLFMPAGLVQVALAMRAGKMRQTAMISGAQVVGANLLSVMLALIWANPLALILPRVVMAPFWLIAQRRLHPWHCDPKAGYMPLRPFVRYGCAVLGTEITKALRLQADKLIIGALMGAEVLGLYFMAFNAGLGLATSFTVALSTVVFPHICAAHDRVQALRHSITLALLLITPVVVAQALLAPFYVPLLFGAGWEDLSGIVSILCLVAIPATLWSAAAGWLRANGRPEVEFWVTATLTSALMINIPLAAPHGLGAVATGYAVLSTAILTLASWPAVRTAFRPTPAEV